MPRIHSGVSLEIPQGTNPAISRRVPLEFFANVASEIPPLIDTRHSPGIIPEILEDIQLFISLEISFENSVQMPSEIHPRLFHIFLEKIFQKFH